MDLVPVDDGPTLSARSRSREELADYLLEIGSTLAAYGCPSHRLEDVLRVIAHIEGHRAEPFALPTGIFLRVTAPDGGGLQVNRIGRVSDWGVDLARLALVDEILNDVAERRSSIDEARVRVRASASRPPEWSPAVVFAATMVVSGGAAVFFQGGAADVLGAAIVGGLIAAVRLVMSAAPSEEQASAAAITSRRNVRRLLIDFAGGLIAASCAGLALQLSPEARPEVIVPAGAISLFPGMTFTTGVAEVAQKNVVSGGARLIESAVALLLILFGVALVAGVADVLGVGLPHLVGGDRAARAPLPLVAQLAAVTASSVGFAALFQVPRRWLLATLAVSATGWAVAAAAAHARLPGHLAAFSAALALCALANKLARVTNRPAQLFQIPGMMLLVPGSFGFLSLGDFLEQEIASGAQRAFTMALVGAALVTGVLMANLLVPSRKLL